MARRLLWLVVPGIVTIVGGTALAVVMTGEDIASSLKLRAAAVLADPELAWASVDVSMRDASVSGVATDPQAVDEALRRVAAVDGVRSVASHVVLAEHVSPFPFSARLEQGAIHFSGGLPDAAMRDELFAAYSASGDDLRLMSGAPPRAALLATIRHGLDYLKQFDEGEIRLADLELTVVGRAASREAFEALNAMRRAGPPQGIRLARADIAPPLADPYRFTARFAGKQIVLSGDVPDQREADRLAHAVSGVPIRSELELASGAPDGFADDAALLVSTLALLEQGEAHLEADRRSADRLSLSGAPADAATAERVREAVRARGVDLALEPPRVAAFHLAMDKTGARTAFSGHVTDAGSLERLKALPGADVGGLQLARGAPPDFGRALDFALAVLPLLSEAHFVVSADGATLSGRAATPADFDAVQALIADARAAGLSLFADNLRLPLAAPFTWSADKAADGGTAFSGFVPNREARQRLAAAVSQLAGDLSAPADGAPADFEVSAEAGLKLLETLSSGRLAYDGAKWSVTGAADSAMADFRARRLFAALGLADAGWTLSVNLPGDARPMALPVIDPYTWRARKGADGRISFAGFAPSAVFQRFMRERAGDASDASTLGAGAPADFPVEALAGLDALMRLDEGSLGLSGGAWSLSGRAGSGAARELALAALAPLGQARPWTVAIEAPEDIAERPAEETPPAPAVAAETPVAPEPQIPPAAPEPPAPQAVSEPQAAPQPPAPPAPEPALAAPAPAAPEAPAATPAPVTLASLAPPSPGSVATPDPMPARFLFEARRDEEGAVAFSGLVPDEVSRTALADYAPVDGLTLGSGMPADFLDSAGAGLAALDRMVDGRMGFGDGVWALKGEAATASDRYAILAALGTAPGGRWRTDVSVMAPLRFCEVRVARFAERNAILFRSGSDAITDDSLPAIDELAGNLQQCPEATISVIGHTDSDGAEDLNLALSVARAEAVAAALAARGINPERLYSVGYGESLPVADNATAAGKQRNRRIAFEIRDET